MRFIRSAVIGIALILTAGCRQASAQRSGYAITDRPPAGSGWQAGDTLAELDWPDSTSRVYRAGRAFIDSLRYPFACARIFGRRAHYLVLAHPHCGPGEDTSSAANDRFGRPEGVALDASGARSHIEYVWATFRELCPAYRDAHGALYPKRRKRIDECQRWPLDIPTSELPPGITTPKGIILPKAVTHGLLDQCSRPTPDSVDGEWTPTIAQVEALEARLPAFLAPSSRRLARPLGDYARQYGGYVVRRDSLIYVNFFLHPPQMPFLDPASRRAVIVCDGGAAFFGLSFDPRTSRFFDLELNGVV